MAEHRPLHPAGLAFVKGAGLGDGDEFVIVGVDLYLAVDEVDDPPGIDLHRAVVILQVAIKQHEVVGDRLLLQVGVTLLPIGSIGAVDLDLPGLVLDGHAAVSRVVDRFDGRRHVVAVGGRLAGLAGGELAKIGDGLEVVFLPPLVEFGLLLGRLLRIRSGGRASVGGCFLRLRRR